MTQKKDKHQAILSVLDQQSDAISMSQLMRLLGDNFKERSVRRWVTQLVEQGDIIKSGAMSSTRYQLVKTKSGEQIFSAKALNSLALIRRPLFQRDPVSYQPQWLDDYQPNKSFYLSDQQIQSMIEQGRRESDHDPAGTYSQKIFNRLLIDLSYNSSRLEGNTYSLLETERLLLQGDPADDKLDLEKVMILNHKEAIRYLVDKAASIQVDMDEVRTVHFLLADGLVEKKYAGAVREYGVRISSSTYIPYEDKRRLEAQLLKICTTASAIENPFEQSFFLLTHLAYLQPFCDVNKRTSRLSANIPLIKGNFVPLSFGEVSKEDYISAMLCIYELNDARPLAELYSQSYARSCKLYDSSVESVGFDRIQVQYRKERREIIRLVITRQISQNKLSAFVLKQAQMSIPKNDVARFVSELLTELTQLTLPRIAGMGISKEDLEKWLASRED